MMLYKSLVSLVVAFAAVSGAAAAATPEARGKNQCSTKTTAVCCNTVTNSLNSLVVTAAALLNIQLDPTLVDGLGCTTVVGGNW
jgi:hypothetical protein